MQGSSQDLYHFIGFDVTCFLLLMDSMGPDQAPNLLNEMGFKKFPEFHLSVFFFDEESTVKVCQKVVDLLSGHRKQILVPLTVQFDFPCIEWGVYDMTKDDDIE